MDNKVIEKAKLIVEETKNKKIVLHIHFLEKDKKMPFPQLKLSDTSLNGTDVEVEREKGNVISIKSGDKILYPQGQFSSSPVTYNTNKQAPSSGNTWKGGNNFSNQNKSGQTSYPQRQQTNQRTASTMNQRYLSTAVSSGKQIESITYPAKAPYNFIPLNDKVVTIDVPEFDTYHKDRFTGFIDIQIDTKTPVYIRGTLSEQEVKDGKESKDVSHFFSPGGKLRIPGSSIRGMIRNIVEIVSFSKFKFCDDKALYYRALADKSNLRNEYSQRMSSFDRNSRRAIYKMSAGVMIKEGFEYFIKPADDFRQIPKTVAKREVAKIGKTYDQFNFYKLSEGYLVVSGDMNNKKKDWLISFPTSNKCFQIPEKDVDNYKNDIIRSEKNLKSEKDLKLEKNSKLKKTPNLISLARNGEVPCFYRRWIDTDGEERISFGHTAMFRLAYEKTVKEHIYPQLKDEKIIDISEAIFGREADKNGSNSFAGRVFFEDAFLCEGQGDVAIGEKSPKILSSPKPTTFQHYLVQNSDDIKQVNHYNTDAALRGYKLYWHKSGNNWEEKDLKEINEHPKQYTKITPVKAGVKFAGRIRFENLSNVELGALLFSIELPKECFHKIGMAKPLGLGSIKLTPKLFLSDRKKRYESFFAEMDMDENGNIETFKKAFETYVKGKIGVNTGLWDVDRLKQLKTMLDFAKGIELEKQGKTRYMQITPRNEFKDRPVLPRPDRV